MLAVHRLGDAVTDDGSSHPVDEYTLSSPVVAVRLATLGATIRGVVLGPRNGCGVDVVLAYDDLTDHLTDGRGSYLGATVGRYANRIGDARFELDGRVHRLAPNEGGNQLHGGPVGFDRHVWTVAGAGETAGGATVRLSLTSAGGDQGYPGTLAAAVSVTVAGDTIVLGYEATTDAATVVNLTGHPYWNLAGAGDVLDHELQVAASAYLVVDGEKIPTGEVARLDGTPLDLRRRRRIGDLVRETGGVDLCYVLDGVPGGVRPAAVLTDVASGRRLSISTDQPGLQVYTGDQLEAPFVRHGGVCLEPERFPDAPNHPGFPSAVLRPGGIYRHTTEIQFDLGPGAETDG